MSGLDRQRRRSNGGPGWLYAPAGHLRTPWRLALFVACIVVGQEIALLPLAPLFSAISRVVREPVPVFPWAMLGGILIAVVIALRVVDEESWSSIGLGENDWSLRRLSVGWMLGAVAIVSTALLLAVPGFLHLEHLSIPGLEPGRSTAYEVARAALLMLVFLAPSALWEELVFRGYLWKVAEDAGGETIALWSTSIAFGLIHLTNAGAGVRTTGMVVLAGLCLGVVRMRSGLAAAWLAHLAWNWVMAALLHMAVSGLAFATPGYRIVVSGPAWYTGGEWGPEGGIAAAVVLVGALLLFEGRRMRSWMSTKTRTDRGPTDPSLARVKGS